MKPTLLTGLFLTHQSMSTGYNEYNGQSTHFYIFTSFEVIFQGLFLPPVTDIDSMTGILLKCFVKGFV